MFNSRYPRYGSQQIVVIRGVLWNKLVSDVERLTRMTATPPLFLQEDATGINISLAPGALSGFWARIINATGEDPMNPMVSPFIYDWIQQKESFDMSTGIVSLVDTDPVVSGHYADNPKSGAYNAWELPAQTGYNALDNGTIVWIEVTYDDGAPSNPVYRFHFPTLDECSNPPP